jgi:hypothetical protein
MFCTVIDPNFLNKIFLHLTIHGNGSSISEILIIYRVLLSLVYGGSSYNNNYYTSNFFSENLKISKISVFFTAEGFLKTKRPSF